MPKSSLRFQLPWKKSIERYLLQILFHSEHKRFAYGSWFNCLFCPNMQGFWKLSKIGWNQLFLYQFLKAIFAYRLIFCFRWLQILYSISALPGLFACFVTGIRAGGRYQYLVGINDQPIVSTDIPPDNNKFNKT